MMIILVALFLLGQVANAGFYSNNCTLSCPGTNCGTCHIADGVCTKCVNGYFGSSCNQLCPTNCKYRDCFKENGTCIAGCTDGYTGNQCKCPQNCQCNVQEECIACNAGFYNYKKECTCKKEFCSDPYCTSCSNETMYALEGSCCQCNARCKDGIFSNGYLEKNKDDHNIIIIMAACIGALVLIIIGLVVAIMYLTRRVRSDDTKSDTKTKDNKDVYESPVSVKDENLPTEELKNRKYLYQVDNATFTNVTLNDGNINDLAVDVQDNSIQYGSEQNKYEVLGDRGRANSSDYSSISPYENS